MDSEFATVHTLAYERWLVGHTYVPRHPHRVCSIGSKRPPPTQRFKLNSTLGILHPTP